MELELPFGPWKEIASAEWNGVPTGLYSNPQKTILLVAFSKDKPGEKEGKAQGKQNVLVLMKKPLYLEGSSSSIEKFLQSQKRDMSFIEKIVDKQHFAYVLLESQPFFVEFRKEELVKAVKEQTAELESLAKVTFDVAGNYGCKARELSKVDEPVSENLLGDPIMLFAFGGNKTKKFFSPLEERKAMLGFLVGTKEPVEVTTSELQTTVVFGGGPQDRLKAMQVCTENLLIAGVPSIIVGKTPYLQGIAFPSKSTIELEKVGLPKPTGFALKSYSLGKGFFIDLRFVSSKSLVKTFFPEDLLGVIEGVWGESSLSGLRDKLEAQEKKYAVAKASRVLKVAEKEYPAFFGENTIDELKDPWGEKTGKALFLDCGENAEMQSLAVESILNSLGEPKQDASLGMVIETGLQNLAPETIATISSLQDKVFFLLNTPTVHDAEELKEVAPTLEIELLDSGSEAVASFAGERKRINLRPPFSSGAQ